MAGGERYEHDFHNSSGYMGLQPQGMPGMSRPQPTNYPIVPVSGYSTYNYPPPSHDPGALFTHNQRHHLNYPFLNAQHTSPAYPPASHSLMATYQPSSSPAAPPSHATDGKTSVLLPHFPYIWNVSISQHIWRTSISQYICYSDHVIVMLSFI